MLTPTSRALVRLARLGGRLLQRRLRYPDMLVRTRRPILTRLYERILAVPIIDMPLDALQAYRPEPNRPHDFSAYWERTLAASSAQPLNAQLVPIDYPVEGLRVWDVRYDGWRGARIAGLYLARSGVERGPALVFYHGYSGNKGVVYDYLPWALQGYRVLAADVRGQSGESTDPLPYPGGHVRGWMTLGILSPEDYYYRGVYVDCIRALDLLATLPEVDPERIGVAGISQGGGLSLAVAALDPRPRICMPEVPYLCHFRRALEIGDREPYQEIAAYCRAHPQHQEQVFTTLSYVDNLNLADRIACPVLMTVGLQDLVCPPSTIYAVYNRITSPAAIAVFPFGGHDVFPSHQLERLRFARRYLMG